jgi:large subunit ribosomal protein L17
VLRIEPTKPDQAPSAILELVDGPKDMRFAMTARTIARERGEGLEANEMTRRNIEKVTKYRPNGEEALEKMVEKMRKLGKKSEAKNERDNAKSNEKRWGGVI